jgi:hypothetical protein
MLKMSIQDPDLVLGGSHLGRGSSYYDQEVSDILVYFHYCDYWFLFLCIIDFT